MPLPGPGRWLAGAPGPFGKVSGRLRVWWSGEAVSRANQMTPGLVISGGGSRASFQIGALRYLYDVEGIAPSVITGTSVGAILAAILAQAEDHAGQHAALADIERIGQNLRQGSDLLTELPWYTALRELVPAWQRAAIRPPPQEPRTVTLPTLGSVLQRRGATVPEPTGGTTITLPRWDPAPVLDALSLVWTLGRTGTDLDVLVRGAQQARSMFTPGPIVDQLLDPEVLDPVQLARSSTQLRISVVGLESGELRYVTGDGTLVDRENRPVAGSGRLSVAEAVRASCAIPGVFPPVRLGDEHYVDGGTRENAPVEIAMTHLGVDRCYIVLSSAKGLAPESSYADKDMLSIVLRSTAGIMADEVQLDDVARFTAAGTIVIAPELNLHDELEVEPALIAIATEYGYLRAAEACEGATEDEQRITREIFEIRRRIWELAGTGRPDDAPPRADTLDSERELGWLQRRLRDLVAQVPVSRLPEGAARWGRWWASSPHDLVRAGDRAGSPLIIPDLGSRGVAGDRGLATLQDLASSPIVTVPYSEFTRQVEAGNVKEVFSRGESIQGL